MLKLKNKLFGLLILLFACSTTYYEYGCACFGGRCGGFGLAACCNGNGTCSDPILRGTCTGGSVPAGDSCDSDGNCQSGNCYYGICAANAGPC